MSIICAIDNTEHSDLDALHEYIKPLMKRENYYRKYHPRHDLLTGEPIPFKTVEQYLTTDFLQHSNMRKWVKNNPEKGKRWAINWLKNRKEAKNLIYAPSQAELRSLCCPSMPYYDSIGGYYEITRSLGFKDRYIEQNPEFLYDISDATLIQDTREQTPLRFSVKTDVRKLDYGDYGLSAPHDKGVYIERKSLNDFVSTVNTRVNVRKNKKKDDTEFSNFDRFHRELARATEAGHYIVMLVESPITDALAFDELVWMKHGKATPAYVWHHLRELLNAFPLSFQVVFANGRQDAARKMVRIFQMGEQVKKVDLEYAAEKGLL
jgi:hypothetical protein